jgi:chromatin licensing and DNA replication factor 1
MSEGASTQLDHEKGLAHGGNESSSPETVQKLKVDMEDSESKIESPIPEKSESRSKGVVVCSLASNLLAERYKDRFAGQLLEDEDETDDEEFDVSDMHQEETPIELLERFSCSLFSSHSHEFYLTVIIDDAFLFRDGRHKVLLNLFNRMESSIRLLHMRKKVTTFNNIATQVEVLTKRY